MDNILELDALWNDISYSIGEYCNYPLSQKDYVDNIDLIAEDVANSSFDEDNTDALEQAGRDLYGDSHYEIDDFKNKYNNSGLSSYQNQIKSFLKTNSGEIIIRYNREQKQLEDTLKDLAR